MSLVGATVKTFFEPSSLTPDCALKFSTKENVKLYECHKSYALEFEYFRAKVQASASIKNAKLIGKNHFMFLFTFNSKKFF